MILYNNIMKISKSRWIGCMLKVAFLLASSKVKLGLIGVYLFLAHLSRRLTGELIG